jgi:exopolysaccharide production protein ExoQ
MPPFLALFIWFVLLLALFAFDPAKEPETSPALWVPLIWLFFIGSRGPSLWLGMGGGMDAIQRLEEGNPLDRTISSLLILLAIAILFQRSFPWRDFFARNAALVALLAFALLSVAWSDFPFPTFKKWFRDLGIYFGILVVLSDPRPLEAVRTLLRRVCYLLVPLSILLIKYYPALGRTYSVWTGEVEYQGVTQGKNLLGALCMVSGIFFFWDTVCRWADRHEPQTKRILWVNYAFIGMTLWLLNLAHSVTADVCFALGCLVIATAHTRTGKNHPGAVKALAAGSFFLYLILAWGLGMSGSLAGAVGKSANLSDRTNMWSTLLSMQTHPLTGFGYQSFFLGSRMTEFWQRLGNGDNVNEAHNGYLAIYLDLGLTGLVLLGAFLIASYRRICRRLEPFTPFGSLGLALLTMLLFYNVTEAAFEGGLLWITFLTVALVAPEREEQPAVAPGLSEDERFRDSLAVSWSTGAERQWR